MIVSEGGKILAINVDDSLVLFEGPDGKVQTVHVKQWFGVNGAQVSTPTLALTFAFEVDGFDRHGIPVTQRYDGRLEGLGAPIPRNADGSFGTRRARELNERVMRDYAREGL